MSKKMRIVSEDEYALLLKKNQPVEHAKSHFLVDKGEEASKLLDSKIPDDIKIQLYSSVMSHVNQQLQEILNKPISIKLSGSEDWNILPQHTVSNVQADSVTPFSTPQSTPNSSPGKSLLNSKDVSFLKDFPSSLSNKAYNLLGFLKCHPEVISWDKTGRVTFFGNEFEQDSNIKDLMDYSIRDIQFKKNPPGINRFIKVCKMLNVPATVFSSKVRNDMLGSLDSIQPRETSTQSAEKMSTFPFKNWIPLASGNSYRATSDAFSTPTTSTVSTPHRSRNDKDVSGRNKKRKEPHPQ